MKQVIAMSLIEIHNDLPTGKHLFSKFHIQNRLKQGDASSPLLFVLKYATGKFEANQLSVSADAFNLFDRNTESTKRNREALLHANKKTSNRSLKILQFRYLRTAVANQNCIHNDISSRFISGNVCFYSILNICLSV
jgi:hypothetical protein